MVENLRKRGVKFLNIPESYYKMIDKKIKEYKVDIKFDYEKIKKNNILVDFDKNGFLLQIFTKPVLDK